MVIHDLSRKSLARVKSGSVIKPIGYILLCLSAFVYPWMVVFILLLFVWEYGKIKIGKCASTAPKREVE